MCGFDKIPYHYIGELEVPADADYISEKIGAPRAFNRDTAAYKYSEPVVYECTAETVELVGTYVHQYYLACLVGIPDQFATIRKANKIAAKAEPVERQTAGCDVACAVGCGTVWSDGCRDHAADACIGGPCVVGPEIPTGCRRQWQHPCGVPPAG